MSLPVLHVIVCSTRPGRVGPVVADAFIDIARAHAGFEVERIDLAEVGLPLYDEPVHPIKRDYRHAHTRAWSDIVARADAYVFVTPEYNFGPPPPLVNALNYVYHEWNYKPAGFVSYGGISGGLRAVQMEKLALTALKMMPIPEQVTISLVARQISDGRLLLGDSQQASARTMLDELQRWAHALRTLRE